MDEYASLESPIAGFEELFGIFLACACLLLIQWILTSWHLVPSIRQVWAVLIWRRVNAFWIGGLVGTNFVAYILAKSKREAWVTAAGGLIVLALAFWVTDSRAGFFIRFFDAGRWLGLFGLCALLCQARHRPGMHRFLTVACFTLFVPVATAYGVLTYQLRPDTLDWYAYSFDLALGGQVAEYFFSLYHKSQAVYIVALASYFSLMAAYEILFALQARFPDRHVAPALRTFLVAAVLGFVCYFIFPVVGPLHFFGYNYPAHLPGFGDFRFESIRIYPTPRNGMPSLHFAWALLLYLNVPRRLNYARAAFALYAFLTLLATMGTGEHYFVDLIAALPFTAVVQAVALSMNGKWNAGLAASVLRSLLVFAGFLYLLGVSPGWSHASINAWLITLSLTAHYLFEVRAQRKAFASSLARPVESMNNRAGVAGGSFAGQQ